MLRETENFEEMFDSFFEDFENIFEGREKGANRRNIPRNYSWTPLTDIYEDNNFFKFKIDLPGVEKEDVSIKYSNGTLTVQGERKPEQESDNFKYHKIERKYGKFYRKFDVPQEINEDEISAEFKNGQLTILLPKENLQKSNVVEIQVK